MFKIEPERSKKRDTHYIIRFYPHYFQPPLTRARITGILIFLLSQPSHSVIHPTLLEKSGSDVEKSGRSAKSSPKFSRKSRRKELLSVKVVKVFCSKF